jgi:hypothetical protein
MAHGTALKLALELLHVPSRIRSARQEPLPDDVITLLRIAAGDSDAEQLAVETSERSAKVVKEAAAFYIQQILLNPTADSYRVLGATQRASGPELRRNMALLLRWLHPDVDPSRERSMFAARVVKAWEDLKTPERRQAYDDGMAVALAAKAQAAAAKPGDAGRVRKGAAQLRPLRRQPFELPPKRIGRLQAALRYLRGERS